MKNNSISFLARLGGKKKWLWIVLFIIALMISLGLVYNNFNRLISNAIMKTFNSSVISDVYELKFEKLSVNVLDGNIKVSNVVLQPKEKPSRDYPYINSSFRLTTDKLLLKNVKLFDLLESQILDLDKIEIERPEVFLNLSGAIHVLFPFKDSTVVSDPQKNGIKKSIDSFRLQQFELIGANFHTTNAFEQREFDIANLYFAMEDLFISQNFGLDSMSCKSIILSVESMNGTLLKSAIRNIDINNFKFNMEDVGVQKTLDTLMFSFTDFNADLQSADLNTADSVFHIAMKEFGLSYKMNSFKLDGLEFEPNISKAAMQKQHPFQITQAAVIAGSIEAVNFNFDSLIYKQKLFIEEVVLDSVTASFYKDKTKPIDLKKFPEYPGQQILGIGFPMQINKVTVKNSTIVNRERKPDSSYAKVTVSKLNASVTNLSTISRDHPLVISGSAALENVAPFKIKLSFDYFTPQFSIDGTIGKFDLTGLNPLLQQYTPAILNSGVIDGVSFSGVAHRTKASGKVEFLYHGLNIDLQLHEQAKWKSSLGALAANTYLHSANPASDNVPARMVAFDVERDMNKGFINIVLKSIFGGIRETMMPSKENRKAIHETKKDWKQNRTP